MNEFAFYKSEYKLEQKTNFNFLIDKKNAKDMWIKFKWCRLLGRSSTLPITGHISIIQAARLFFTQG